MDLDPVLLARIQFAFTVTFHIIFPSFTIGLSAYIATLGVMWLRTDSERYHRLMRFWTKIFAVSFAMGVVSGVVLSYQFGTNWSRFSVVAGNVVGPLIGYEVLTAFFLEATFLGILLFGFNRVPPRLYVLSAAIVAIGTAMSAFWILSANSWMQTPTGHEIRDGIAFPVDWLAIIFNPSFPVPLLAYAECGLSDDRVRGARGRRALPASGQACRGRAHHDADGTVADGDPGAAAAVHRRPARTQYAEASADQDRRHGGALGRQQAGRTGAVCLAGPKGGEKPFRNLDPPRLLADPDAQLRRAVSRPQERAAAGSPAGASMCSSASASWSASAST